MSNNTGPQTWNLTMGQGSLQEWVFTFTYPSTGALYPLSGLTWEYCARTSAIAGGTAPISITTTSGTQGVLTVGTAASTVTLTMNPAATSSLTVGGYIHSLWANPATSTAYCWLSGSLLIDGVSQP